jgi:crotonobetainyl-CoA:carnitine CoA-transferase CaiB-like acyl-CoA transferase
MSDAATPVDPAAAAAPFTAAHEPIPPTSPLLKAAGLIGLVACFLGLAVLLATCAGREWFVVSPFIVYAGAAGLVLALIAALAHRRRIGEDTHVLAAFFSNALAIFGGLLEMAILKGWPLLPK